MASKFFYICTLTVIAVIQNTADIREICLLSGRKSIIEPEKKEQIKKYKDISKQ